MLAARLTPLPFSALSWLFGTTRVGFATHLAATLVGTLPKTVAYVAAGAAAGTLVAG